MSKSHALLLIGLVVAALGERLVFDLGPNIELVTMACVLTGLYLPQRFRLVVPLVIMAISDVFLGWGWISLFTWSGFMAMTYLPKLVAGRQKSAMVTGALAGVIGVLAFFFWTNFGVWATDIWGMYPNTLNGLIQAYVRGLPFLRAQLLSALVFVPLGIIVVELVRSRHLVTTAELSPVINKQNH